MSINITDNRIARTTFKDVDTGQMFTVDSHLLYMKIRPIEESCSGQRINAVAIGCSVSGFTGSFDDDYRVYICNDVDIILH